MIASRILFNTYATPRPEINPTDQTKRVGAVAPFGLEDEMKFRKKPVVIEAFQLTRRWADEVVDWIGKENISEFNLGEFAEDACYIQIRTLEGIMEAREGDWIIKGIKGELYPCKPDIFDATYEPVEP